MAVGFSEAKEGKAVTARSRTCLLFALLLLAGGSATAEDKKEAAARPRTSGPRTYLLAVGKGMIVDPPRMQALAATSIRNVASGVKTFQPLVEVVELAEGVYTKEQYQRGEVKEKVTIPIVRERLKRLGKEATAQDTVLIYTHCHGRKAGFEEVQPLGGLVLDLPVRRTMHRGTLLWNEYAELFLRIRARNVLVLTMSCFSGGLIEYLNRPKVKALWKDRREKEGRNFLVLTSQNKDKKSPPIARGGEVINPFTYALSKAFAGEADGFRLERGKPVKGGKPDGKLTVGEVVDYVLYATENTKSERSWMKNIAKPQVTGSYHRDDVLLSRGETSGKGHQEKGTNQ